ncbi:phosphatase PAP2 family protein, partial [Winogradskyella sp.]
MIETQVLQAEIARESDLNDRVETNFKQVRLNQLFVPIILFIMIFCFFVCTMHGSFVNTYVESQKGLFLKLNSILSIHPNLAHNISYLGDALILFPFIFIFLFIKPKLWEAIIISSLFTLITSAILKLIFAVPRPAAMINMETFTIMGRPNILHTSLPSGH